MIPAMRKQFVRALAILVAIDLSLAWAGEPGPKEIARLLDCSGKHRSSLDELCQQAVNEDKVTADHAIRELRARGEFGLRTLLEAHSTAIQQHAANRTPATDPA